MVEAVGFSQETMEILSSEDADKKRSAIRARYRQVLESRLGKPIPEWFKILEGFDPFSAKTQYQLAKHLQAEHDLDIADANMVVYYYLNPDKRHELG